MKMYDFDSIEFNSNQQPVFYVSLKHQAQKEINVYDDQHCCLRNCVLENKPFAIIQYYYWDANNKIVRDGEKTEVAHAQYLLVPANKTCFDGMNRKQYVWLTEKAFYIILCKIRNIAPEPYLMSKLSNYLKNVPLPNIKGYYDYQSE